MDTPEVSVLGLFLVGLLIEDLSDAEEEFLLDSVTPTQVDNEQVHGTCETAPAEAQYDIRASVGVQMVPSSLLDPASPYFAACGPVGDGYVFCPPNGQPVTFGEYVTIVGFSLGGDLNLVRPDTRTQLGLTFWSEGGTPWDPLQQYMCDSWGGMTSFFHVNALTAADGTVTGAAEFSMPDGSGGIDSQPANGIVVVQNGEVLGVLDGDSTPAMTGDYRVNLDQGVAGDYTFYGRYGGDTEDREPLRTFRPYGAGGG